MPLNGGATQTFENADVKFVGLEPDHAVEVHTETFQRLARKPGDQVGMDQSRGFLPQEAQRVLDRGGGLRPTDARVDLFVKSLHANFQP